MPPPTPLPVESWFPGPQAVCDNDAKSLRVYFDTSTVAVRTDVAHQQQLESATTNPAPPTIDNPNFRINEDNYVRLLYCDQSHFKEISKLSKARVADVWYDYSGGSAPNL